MTRGFSFPAFRQSHRPVEPVPPLHIASHPLQAPAKSRDQTLILSGFFGRGNCGDEAILQAQFERLSPRFNLVISVDHHDAYDGFWNWYPYDLCEIIHTSNLGICQRPDVIGLHVGGGGLPHGFNAAQVIHARSAGIPVLLSGVDAVELSQPAAAACMKSYYGLFDLVSLRSTASHHIAQQWVSDCHLGADWALALPTDGDTPPTRSDRVLLVLREFPYELLGPHYLRELDRLIQCLSDRYSEVMLLPFCPEDERFLENIPSTRSLSREVHWWNPRRVQREIASAALVVSVGRLHPLIFAANVQTPAIFAEALPGSPTWKPARKVQQFCQEYEWTYYSGMPALTSALEADIAPGPIAFPASSREQWIEMSQKIEDCLLSADANRL